MICSIMLIYCSDVLDVAYVQQGFGFYCIGTAGMWLIFHKVLYVVCGICIAGKCSMLHKVYVL